MTPALEPVVWRRLDVPGHDTATLRLTGTGAVLSGMAVFLGGAPTALRYTVRCDGSWHTVDATVHGWRGFEAVDLRLRRDQAGEWTLNEVPCPQVSGCPDLDLSFTPATNLLPLRRLDLAAGQAAEVRSAWLEWPDIRLTPLVQRYACRAPGVYDYESDLPGAAPFRGRLRTQPAGWVLDYAGLWRAEES